MEQGEKTLPKPVFEKLKEYQHNRVETGRDNQADSIMSEEDLPKAEAYARATDMRLDFTFQAMTIQESNSPENGAEGKR